MILDASALLAVLLGEKHSAAIVELLQQNVGSLRISHVTVTEVTMTLMKRGAGQEVFSVVQDLLQRLEVELVATTLAQTQTATLARNQFGINFGDCFVYALAREFRAPILTLDADFRRADADIVPLR